MKRCWIQRWLSFGRCGLGASKSPPRLRVGEKAQYHFAEPLPSLAGLIARALLELVCNNLGKICLRLPSLVVIAENQLLSRILDRAGHLRLLVMGPA